MASTPNLDFAEIDPNQQGKAATANTAFLGIDQTLSGWLAIQADALGYASPYTIPYSTQDEPTGDKTALRFFRMTVTGALTANWTAYLPAGKAKPFVVTNNTTGGHNVIVMVAGQTGVTVAPGETIYCYLNGIDVEELPFAAATGSQPWDIGNFIEGSPTAGQVVMHWIMTRTVTFPANFSSNQMKCFFTPTATATFNINKNGVNVGAGTIDAGGSLATWTSVGGLPIVYSAGDDGAFIAPNPADGTLANIVWAFSGVR